MFKNPLKYQNGGAVQAREQVVSAISEIAQIPIEEVNSKLDQISQDQESIQLLSEALQAVQKGDERGYQVIKKMFNPQSETGVFAKGGKIQDFICKHAKGGNVKECGCGGKTEKYQNPAGPIGRRQALDAAKANYGFNDSQSRMAYANAKNALRSQGLRGRELRQQARQMLMGQLPQETRRPLLAVVDAPQLPQAYSTNNTSNLLPQEYSTGNTSDLAGGTKEQQQLNNSKQVRDYSGSSFNTAFSNARRAYMNNNGPGLFRWNGNLYNTNLGSSSNTTGGSNSNSNQNKRFSVWNNEYTRSGLGREEAMERAADKYGVILFDQQGGKVVKAQNGLEEMPYPVVYENYLVLPKDAPEHKNGLEYTLSRFNRGGGGDTSDYGNIVEDENGLLYRDVRDTDWNSAFGRLSQSYHREYVPNKAYKRAIKRGFKPIYDEYTSQQKDSLKTVFDEKFGNFGTANEDGTWGTFSGRINKFGVPIQELDYDEKIKNRLGF